VYYKEDMQMVTIIKTKKHGFEVYMVLVNRLAVATFMSEGGAVNYCKVRGLI
jgi:hypothetical protein